jgi:hypothetical protein
MDFLQLAHGRAMQDQSREADAMSLVRVLIVHGREPADWFAPLLAGTLSGLPDFHLVDGSSIATSRVYPLLKNAPVDAVIIAGTDPDWCCCGNVWSIARSDGHRSAMA